MKDLNAIPHWPVRRFWLLLWLGLLGGGMFDECVQAASMKAALDRQIISQGESVNFSLTFDGGAPASQPVLPALPGVRVNGTTASQNYSFVNGKTSQQTTYTYVLTPANAGEVMIPAIRANVGGQTLASQPLKLKITAGTPAAATTAEGSPGDVFLKLVLPKTEMYVGEIVPAEVQLYFQAINNPTLPQIPAQGFTMSPMPNRPEQTQRQINGVTYNLVIFRFSLSPARSGELTLGPATCGVTVLSDPRRDFFGQVVYGRSRPANLTSEAVAVQVRPLPANPPPTFNGAIGSFNMNVSAAPTDVAVSDPITVKVDISGRGALENLVLPPQPEWREFKMYPPNSQMETSDPLGLEGVKHFELVIAPQNAGIKALPPLQFSFFDPEQKAYRTLSAPLIQLHVRASAATPQPTVASAAVQPNDAPVPAKEIVHIKPLLGVMQTASRPLVTQPWFIGTQCVAPLLWLGVVVYRRQREKIANNPRAKRQKAAEKMVKASLEKLQQQAAANQSDDFFATVFHVLQEQIGERLDLPASAITEAVVEEELRWRNLPPATLAQLRELFSACNQARYAPVRSSQELASFIPKVETVVTALKMLKNEKSSLPGTAALRLLGFLGLVFFLAGGVQAQDVAQAFSEANRLYEQQKFSEAAASYEKILAGGKTSVALWFNLGNAYFKAGQTGRAIAAYRRAEEISPRDPDVKANLQFAKEQVSNGHPLRENLLVRMGQRLTLNEWTILSAAAVWGCFLLLILGQWKPDWRQPVRGYVLVGAGVTVGLLAGLSGAVRQQFFIKKSVVIVAEAVVRRGPFEESQSSFTLRDGTELTVLDKREHWLQISAPTKGVGWLPETQVSTIR